MSRAAIDFWMMTRDIAEHDAVGDSDASSLVAFFGSLVTALALHPSQMRSGYVKIRHTKMEAIPSITTRLVDAVARKMPLHRRLSLAFQHDCVIVAVALAYVHAQIVRAYVRPLDGQERPSANAFVTLMSLFVEPVCAITSAICRTHTLAHEHANEEAVIMELFELEDAQAEELAAMAAKTSPPPLQAAAGATATATAATTDTQTVDHAANNAPANRVIQRAFSQLAVTRSCSLRDSDTTTVAVPLRSALRDALDEYRREAKTSRRHLRLS